VIDIGDRAGALVGEHAKRLLVLRLEPILL
jgi:hypothetical protein